MNTPRTTVHRCGSTFTQVVYRTPTDGPELKLVNQYIAEHIAPPPRGQALTVFIEPEVASGFPDVVAVYWSQAVASQWHGCRAHLTSADVRVAHHLATTGCGDLDTLQRFFRPWLAAALDRLDAAGVAYRVGRQWRAKCLKSIFAVRSLVAIEAKVADWRDGLWQAVQNTWFASESYLLLPRLPRRGNLAEEAARFGVGVAARDTPLRHAGVPPRTRRIPLSYASWLFNEWAWRAAHSTDAGPEGKGHDVRPGLASPAVPPTHRD